MRKRKLAITIVFFVGVIATVASAFSVYVLDPDSSKQINVDSNDIDVIERKQTFLSYVGIGKNISVYDNDIVSDVFSMKLEINQKEFNAIPTVPANSGLKLEINFGSKELFDYVKKDVKNEMIRRILLMVKTVLNLIMKLKDAHLESLLHQKNLMEVISIFLKLQLIIP